MLDYILTDIILSVSTLYIIIVLVKSFEELLKYKSEIITISEALNARAYIHLSPRNFLSVQSGMLASIAECYKSKTYQHIPKLFNTICGKETGSRKLWLFDLDDKSPDANYSIKQVFRLIGLNEKREILVDIFDTKNGFHFITNPFDVSKTLIPSNLELHKNNPTILYV